jgi:hypothetical protein
VLNYILFLFVFELRTLRQDASVSASLQPAGPSSKAI